MRSLDFAGSQGEAAATSVATQAGGISSTYTRSVEGGIPGGLDPAKLQAVADAYLDRLEADLTAAGFEVVPYQELAANAMFQRLSSKYLRGITMRTRKLDLGKGTAGQENVVTVSPKDRPYAADCASIWLKQSIVPQQNPFTRGATNQGEKTSDYNAGSGGPVNSTSIQISTSSPTPIVVPGAGMP